MGTLKTKRLILRPWKKEDLEPFAKLNADPRVMEYFPSPLTREQSKTLLESSQAHIEKYGFGKWAAILRETGAFIGRIGLETVDFQAGFSPNVELGYRLAFNHWNKGYASEGAKAAIKYGFTHLNLEEVVAFTPILNLPSQAVMKRIGMHHDPKDDFDHPRVHGQLQRHVLYRLTKREWLQNQRKYVFKPYNKIFPDLFQQEKMRIASSLTIAFAIEHIGSTAIPNLGGKGIIDIAISCAKDEMVHSRNILEQLGYEFRPSFSTPDRWYFIIFLPDQEKKSRRYHIHLTYPNSKEWQEMIRFRDYLKNHPEAREEYAKLKKQAVKVANQDPYLYRKLKEPFFKRFEAYRDFYD